MTTHRGLGRAQRGAVRACVALVVLAALGALGAFTHPASAAEVVAVEPSAAAAARATPRWWSIGVLGGSVQPDGELADYQWRTSPRAAWGAQALAGARWFSGGLRLWNTRTQQEISAAQAATVRGTSWELVGRGRLLRVGGSELLAVASGGRLHLGYSPDQIEIAGGSGEPVAVTLGPIDEWIAGGGLALERRVAGVWRLGIEVERRVFSLDTAHRSGDAIIERREALGDWNARIELARLGTSR